MKLPVRCKDLFPNRYPQLGLSAMLTNPGTLDSLDKRLSRTPPRESQAWDGERRERLGREAPRDAPPVSLYTSVHSRKARRRQSERNPNKVGVPHRLLPVRGVRVVELPGNYPTHQQPPVVHDGTRRSSAPPEVARPGQGQEPRRRPNLAASPSSPASQTAP